MTVSECNLLEKIGATLSPCPFCGRDPKYRIQRKGAEREVYIKCRGCNARSGVMRCLPEELLDALKDAVDAWNRRAADVVEVVRCDKCKHGTLHLNSEGVVYVVCAIDDSVRSTHDFCSFGEQMNNDAKDGDG